MYHVNIPDHSLCENVYAASLNPYHMLMNIYMNFFKLPIDHPHRCSPFSVSWVALAYVDTFLMEEAGTGRML